MPLVIGQGPALWERERGSQLTRSVGGCEMRAECIQIAFINNMPDAALEDTELQFFELLDTASGDLPVSVKLFSLPGLLRSDSGHRHLADFYFGIEDLLNGPFDGVIITGTEPRQPDLRDETYWRVLVKVLDWAEQNTLSTILSCLAAHAGVLYSDGIERHVRAEKQFGVFDYQKVLPHVLTRGPSNVMRIPHSRWNELKGDALRACGYAVLTQSSEGGVDLFVKKKKRSLFVHFQGHPEYGTRTLLKEYQRDIKKFLRRERDTYPSMPYGYFDAAATDLLADFREKALHHPQAEVLGGFPEAAVVETLQNTWHSSATCVYRHWLQYVALRKAELRRSQVAMGAPHRSISSGVSNTHD
jgi:homoserine O-succinyltransferase/O-acetyltransferase